MLFNSYIFIFAFLPIALVGYYLLGAQVSRRSAIVWLSGCSLFFYGWWDLSALGLILVSIAASFVLGRAIGRTVQAGSPWSRRLLACGVVGNLGLLGYYKYSAFLVANVAALTGLDFTVRAVVLPLAISFYTFQQIAYLVDAARGEKTDYGLIDYILFVTFFPQLIAGPIVHHKEVMPQFEGTEKLRFDHARFALGITFFAVGLFKKVVLADNLALVATPLFDTVAAGDAAPTAVAAWTAALAYTLQLYFDFSGYSDMAVGLGHMFGIRLPYNFNSPYKATSIIDFWRRWHITLSRFLRDYLYIPLGGNRHGRARRYLNLALTMILGGLWHGAGWTFVIWGALHGLYLIANHAWEAVKTRLDLSGHGGIPGRWTGRLLTFGAVMVAWVFFRSSSVDAALSMLNAMTGANGLVAASDPLAKIFAADAPSWSSPWGIYWRTEEAGIIMAIPFLLLVVWFAPNSQEWICGERRRPARGSHGLFPLAWRPTPAMAGIVATGLLFTLTQLSQVSEFIYFQF